MLWHCLRPHSWRLRMITWSNWCHRRERGCIQVTLDGNEPLKKLLATERLNNEHSWSRHCPFSLILPTPKCPITEVHESASAPIRVLKSPNRAISWPAGMLERRSLGQVFATFATFFYSFQQLPKYSKYMQFNVLSCFQGCYIATFCNIFDFCVQLFTAIFFKCCAKCKSVIKKNTKLFQFSSILFDCMKKGYMTD